MQYKYKQIVKINIVEDWLSYLILFYLSEPEKTIIIASIRLKAPGDNVKINF